MLTKIEIIVNFEHNRDFHEYWPKSKFPQILTKIEIFKFFPKISIFEDFD